MFELFYLLSIFIRLYHVIHYITFAHYLSPSCNLNNFITWYRSKKEKQTFSASIDIEWHLFMLYISSWKHERRIIVFFGIKGTLQCVESKLSLMIVSYKTHVKSVCRSVTLFPKLYIQWWFKFYDWVGSTIINRLICFLGFPKRVNCTQM